MTPAERQRRSRVEQKLRSPTRFVEESQIAVESLRWTFARIEDPATEGETRRQGICLLEYCNDLKQTEKNQPQAEAGSQTSVRRLASEARDSQGIFSR